MKILFTYPFVTGKGGMERVITDVLNYKTNDILYLLLPGGSKDKNWLKQINNDHVQVILHNKHNPIEIFNDTFKSVIKIKPDIVITMNNLQILPILMARKVGRLKFKLYSWNHFSLKHTKANFLLKKCDAFLAISSGIKDELIQLGINPNKIYLIYNPVKPTNRIIKLFEEKPMHFIYVGRIQYQKQKNLKEMYQILGLIKNLNWVLDIYGDGLTEDKNKLYELSQKLGISKRINYFGWQKDVWHTIQYANLLLLTSNYEGFPMAIAEAISYGIPVISADCPSGPRDIINSINGALYPKGNIKIAAKEISDFYNKKLVFGSQKDIVDSIDNFYIDKYMARLFNILNNK